MYEEALKLGKESVTYGHVMFIGPPGVGKTSLLHALMNKTLPQANSTIVADTKHILPQWVDASGHMHWKEISERDEITELARLVKTVQPELKYKKHQSTSSFKTISSHQPSKRVERLAQSALEAVVEKVSMIDYSIEVSTSDHFLHIWDCGGQPVFLNVIPAFLTSSTMFYLLFDASKDLNSKVEILWHHEGQAITEGEMCVTTVDLLLQWMAMVHTSFSKDGLAKVAIVGTHSDHLNAEDKKKIKAEIEFKCRDSHFKDILTDITFVDNTTAGKGEMEDQAITDIRKACQKFVSKLEVTTPTSWVLFRKILSNIAGEHPVISYSDAKAVARVCNISMKSLPSVLKFYHDLGVFLFYANIPDLNRKVIIKPDWLIHELGKLLCPSESQRRCQPGRFRSKFETSGVLDQQLYNKIWESNDNISPREMMYLLKSFLLAIPMWETTEENYFLPLMLTRTSSSSLIEAEESSAPLHLIFETKYTPPGYFIRLIASLSKHPKFRVDLERDLHCDIITILYGDKFAEVDEITISQSLTSICIQVLRMKSNEKTFDNVVKDIHMALLCAIEEVKQWFPSNTTTQLAFHCEEESCVGSPQHFISIENHLPSSTARCQKNAIHSFNRREAFWLLPKPTMLIARRFKQCFLGNFRLKLFRPREVETTTRPIATQQPNSKPSEQSMDTQSLGRIPASTTKDVKTSALKGPAATSADSKRQDVVSDYQLLECSRVISADGLSSLAHQLGIPDEEVRAIRSKYKSPQVQAKEMLDKWKEREGRRATASRLERMLHDCGLTEATRRVCSQGTPSLQYSQQKPQNTAHLDKKPTVRELVCLKTVSPNSRTVRCVKKSESRWDDLALFLGLEAEVDSIQSNFPRDVHRACKKMLQLWLEGQGRTPVTWRTLLDALEDADMTALADDLRGALEHY